MDKKKIRKTYHKVNAKIKGIPFLVRLNILLVPIFKHFYFKNERLLLKGKDISQSDKSSVLFFTAHKCGSTYINGIIERLGYFNKIVPIHFSNYFQGVDNDQAFRNSNFLNKSFKSKGYYYGAFRKFHFIPNLDEYRILLVLRDPRDVLTSHYFSTLFNHPISRKKTIENRKRTQHLTIDEYVIEYADEFLSVYDCYINNLLNRPNVLFLKYEDMITNFDKWIRKLSNHIRFDGNEALIDKIISESNFTVKKEDKNAFIRNIKAGDHLNKLQPSTIKQLNEKFKEVLVKLNYNHE